MFEAKKPDERTGRVAWRTVLETYERIAPGVLHLTVEAANDNEVNGSTASDPNNTSLTLRAIERDDTVERVYNFAVQSLPGEITHNYLVGDRESWTHNARRPTLQSLGPDARAGKNPHTTLDWKGGKVANALEWWPNCNDPIGMSPGSRFRFIGKPHHNVRPPFEIKPGSGNKANPL